jgi:hypothetical protein
MNTCIKCGCDDAYPSLPPCPTPVDCPNPQPCAEFFDAQCVMYTLKNITCGSNIVVAQDSSIAEALESIVLFFCTNSLNCIQSVTDNGAGGVYVNNADPLNPIISFTGIFVDGTLSGDGTFANPLSVISSGGVTGSGTLNYLARWTPNGTTLGIGVTRDDGVSVGIGAAPSANALLYVSNASKNTTVRIDQLLNATSITNGAYITNTGTNTQENRGLEISVNNSSLTNTGLLAVVTANAPAVGVGGTFIVGGTSLSKYALRLQDGTEGVGKVLTCITGNGEAQWQTPSSGGGLTWSTITGPSPVVTLAANNGYVIRDTTGAFTSLTLPSSGVVVGDIIKISATTEGGGGSLSTWQILEGRVFDVIFYSFYDPAVILEYTGVLSTSPLLTFDDTASIGTNVLFKNQSLTLTCVQDLGTGYAWNIELANGKMIG